MALALGYPHPDIMLAQLTSRQVAEWLAFATLEPVGNPIPKDPEQAERERLQAQRAKVEGGLRALKQKQEAE